MDAIFALRYFIEKYEKIEKGLYVVFAGLEKAFGRVPREVIWWVLREKDVMESEMRAMMER